MTSNTEIKRINYLYDGLPSGLGAILSILLIISYSISEVVDSTVLFPWLGLNILVLFLRVLSYIYYKKTVLTTENSTKFYLIFFILTSMSAILLGSGAFVIFPNSLIHQMIILFMLTSLTAGASVSLAARIEIFYIYILCTLFPYLYIYLTSNTAELHILALVLFIYITILMVLSKKISKSINSNIEFALENKDLVIQLEDRINEANLANKAKSEFLANMSHELRTPLNAIIGFSGILMKKLHGTTNIDLSRQINTSSNSLLQLINDILDLSKIQDSSFTIEPFEFNAYKEMFEFTQQFEGLTAKKTLIFHNRLNDNLKGTFYGDWVRINQICLNLISNAVKFTPKDGEITFSGDYKEHSLIISIKDNGIGMNKEVQDKIFKPFEQADGSTTRKYGGTGLGLSITQNLVEMMNGKIELESKEGEGTTFKVTIPLEQLESTTLQESEVDLTEDKENTLTGHILIVEDNKTNQMLVRMLIEDFGLTCDIANDGIEAVDIYNPARHSLILMDENMPNMNGIEAMKIIKEKYQDKCTPILALTANAMKGDRERFLELGMDGYVAKPIDGDELYNILVELLQ